MFILGAADTIAAILLIRGLYDLPIAIPDTLIIVFAAYLIVKAVIFIYDIGSVMDIGAGILLLVSISHPLHPVIFIIFAILLAVKGILTLIAGIRF